jgi:hypothetical protein
VLSFIVESFLFVESLVDVVLLLVSLLQAKRKRLVSSRKLMVRIRNIFVGVNGLQEREDEINEFRGMDANDTRRMDANGMTRITNTNYSN